MTKYEALEIVLELADIGVLTEKEALEVPEVLEPVRKRQLEAINKMHNYLVQVSPWSPIGGEEWTSNRS